MLFDAPPSSHDSFLDIDVVPLEKRRAQMTRVVE